MLILIISILLLIIGLVIWKIGKKKYRDGIEFGGIIVSIFSAIAVVVCIVLTMTSHINIENQYQKDYMEYEILQAQMDSEESNKVTIASEVISYNRKVMDYQKYYSSPWIGLYYYDGCETLPLLNIEK